MSYLANCPGWQAPGGQARAVSFIPIFGSLSAIACLTGVSEEKACFLLTSEVAEPGLGPEERDHWTAS